MWSRGRTACYWVGTVPAGPGSSLHCAFVRSDCAHPELGDQRQTAFLLAYLAVAVAHQGDFERAEALVAESRELFRALGDTGSFEANLGLLGEGLGCPYGRGPERAENRFNASLSLGQILDAKAIVAATLGGWGRSLWLDGRTPSRLATFARG